MHAELQSILYIIYILIYLYGATFCLLGGGKKGNRGPGQCRVRGAPPHRQPRPHTGVSRWIFGGAAAICGLRPVMQRRCVGPVR